MHSPSPSHPISPSRAPARGLATFLLAALLLVGLFGPAPAHASVAGPQTRPAAFASNVATVTPAPVESSTRTGTATGCAAAVSGTSGFTPNQLMTAYGFDGLQADGLGGQGETVALIEVDGFNPSDLRTFAQCFGLSVPPIHTVGVGLKNPLPAGGEATLDLEMLLAAAPKLKAIDVYETGSSATDMMRALQESVSGPRKPDVAVMTGGYCESQLVRDIGGKAGLSSIENFLSAAAASGVTIVSATGDAGSTDCLTASGMPTAAPAISFPASSPDVTAVGGTSLALTAGNQISSQTAWNDEPFEEAAGGGGFSSLFGRPSYQDGVVSPNARAVPDVSLDADVYPGYTIFCGAAVANCAPGWSVVGGTSAAAPLMAGGFALVDQDLRQHGLQDLGLANPLLYEAASADAAMPLAAQVFSDVTQGSNGLGGVIGYSAGPGYDEASGLGSVNLANLANYALTQQPPLVSVGLTVPAHQSPVRRGALLATVSVSGSGRVGAYAAVKVGRGRPFTVRSAGCTLETAGAKTISLHFTRAEKHKMRAGLAAHQRITATVTGVQLDADRDVEKRTTPKSLTIRS